MVYLYNGILLSHWKEWNNAICSTIDGPRDFYTEWKKSDREGEISNDLPCMSNQKRRDISKLIYKTETDSQM